MYAYIARQPIFSKARKINAYELLFREGDSNCFPEIDGDAATMQLLSNAFMTTNINNYTGGKKAFINFTRNLLINRIPLMLPQKTTVVEILEDVMAEKDVLESCREIVRRGYKIALDDFIYDINLSPLISLADIIKFDFRQSSIDDIVRDIHQLEKYNLKFLAEKVETYEEFRSAVELGFDYFQGYFFSKPEMIRKKKLSSTKLNLLRILNEVGRLDTDYDKLENYISNDLTVSYKLLRYVNSPYFRRSAEISTIQQAITLLGQNEIRRFISLMSMEGLCTDKPEELVKLSSVRAKFCELLALAAPQTSTNPQELFMLGLFSLLDAILDFPMEDLLKELPLSPHIKEALMSRKGFDAYFLRLITSYEKGRWDDVAFCSSMLDIQDNQLPGFYLEAIQWGDMLANL